MSRWYELTLGQVSGGTPDGDLELPGPVLVEHALDVDALRDEGVDDRPDHLVLLVQADRAVDGVARQHLDAPVGVPSAQVELELERRLDGDAGLRRRRDLPAQERTRAREPRLAVGGDEVAQHPRGARRPPELR